MQICKSVAIRLALVVTSFCGLLLVPHGAHTINTRLIERPLQVLNSEAFQNGGSVAYRSENLLLPPALPAPNEARPREVRIQQNLTFLSAEAGQFVSSLQNGPAGACEAIKANMKAYPPGATSGPEPRQEDIRFFTNTSATRTCWQNASKTALSSELRQVFFVPKRAGITAAKVFETVSRAERYPSQTERYHHYEYKDPNNLSAGVIARANTALPDEEGIPFDRPMMIKKCLTIFNGDKYCNTIVHRAYSLGDNAFMLTAHLYDLSKGDVRLTQDAYGDRNVAALGRNTASAYSAFYLVVDMGNEVAVYNIGIQQLDKECQGDFYRARLKDGHLNDFAALRRFVEAELGSERTSSCASI